MLCAYRISSCWMTKRLSCFIRCPSIFSVWLYPWFYLTEDWRVTIFWNVYVLWNKWYDERFVVQQKGRGPQARSCGGWESKHKIEIPKPILSQIPPPKGRSACVSVWYLFTEPYPQWNLRWQASQRLYWALKAYAQASGCEGVLRRLKRAVGFRIWGLHVLYSRNMGVSSKVFVALCSLFFLFILSPIPQRKLAIFKGFDDFFVLSFISYQFYYIYLWKVLSLITWHC